MGRKGRASTSSQTSAHCNGNAGSGSACTIPSSHEPNVEFSNRSDTRTSSSSSDTMIFPACKPTKIRRNFSGITPSQLKELIAKENPKTILQKKSAELLVIDCRMLSDFQTRKVNHVPTAHFAITDAPPPAFIPDFTSKEKVAEYFLRRCHGVLKRFPMPGQYSTIAILDNCSTSKTPSEAVQTICEAMHEWNLGTKTSIKIAEGGLYAFKAEFPDFVIGEIFYATKADAFYEKFETVKSSNPVEQQNVVLLKHHFELLTQDIKVSKEILKNRSYIKVLEKVNSIVSKEGKDGLVEQLESQMPDIVKCPVCFEVYAAEIYQCSSGHCLCSKCSLQINHCTQCRIPLSTTQRIRNRALEQLLLNSLFATCSCGDKFAFKDLGDHVDNCVLRDFSQVPNHICHEKMNITGSAEEDCVSLTDINKEILENDHLWITKFSDFSKYPVIREHKDIFQAIHQKRAILNDCITAISMSVFPNLDANG